MADLQKHPITVLAELRVALDGAILSLEPYAYEDLNVAMKAMRKQAIELTHKFDEYFYEDLQ